MKKSSFNEASFQKHVKRRKRELKNEAKLMTDEIYVRFQHLLRVSGLGPWLQVDPTDKKDGAYFEIFLDYSSFIMMLILMGGVYVWSGTTIYFVLYRTNWLTITDNDKLDRGGCPNSKYGYTYELINLAWGLWYFIVPMLWYFTLANFFRKSYMRDQLELLDFPSAVHAFNRYNTPLLYQIAACIYGCIIIGLLVFDCAEQCKTRSDWIWFDDEWYIYYAKMSITIMPPLFVVTGFTLLNWIASIHRALYGRLIATVMVQQRELRKHRIRQGRAPEDESKRDEDILIFETPYHYDRRIKHIVEHSDEITHRKKKSKDEEKKENNDDKKTVDNNDMTFHDALIYAFAPLYEFNAGVENIENLVYGKDHDEDGADQNDDEIPEVTGEEIDIKEEKTKKGTKKITIIKRNPKRNRYDTLDFSTCVFSPLEEKVTLPMGLLLEHPGLMVMKEEELQYSWLGSDETSKQWIIYNAEQYRKLHLTAIKQLCNISDRLKYILIFFILGLFLAILIGLLQLYVLAFDSNSPDGSLVWLSTIARYLAFVGGIVYICVAIVRVNLVNQYVPHWICEYDYWTGDERIKLYKGLQKLPIAFSLFGELLTIEYMYDIITYAAIAIVLPLIQLVEESSS